MQSFELKRFGSLTLLLALVSTGSAQAAGVDDAIAAKELAGE